MHRLRIKVVVGNKFFKGDFMEHEDIIHRLQIIRDLVRDGRKLDADVKLDSIQRMIAEEKLTSDNSDYAKLKEALESIADCGGCLTGEDAQEMNQIAIEALQ